MRKLVIPKYYGRPSIGLALFGCTNRPFYHICVFPDRTLGRRYESNILEQVRKFISFILRVSRLEHSTLYRIQITKNLLHWILADWSTGLERGTHIFQYLFLNYSVWLPQFSSIRLVRHFWIVPHPSKNIYPCKREPRDGF